MKIKEIR